MYPLDWTGGLTFQSKFREEGLFLFSMQWCPLFGACFICCEAGHLANTVFFHVIVSKNGSSFVKMKPAVSMICKAEDMLFNVQYTFISMQISYGNIEVTRIEEERVPSCYLVTHLSVKNMVVRTVCMHGGMYCMHAW